MKYQTYPAYKDSGVEWFGKVPEHWYPLRFKYVISEKKKTSNANLDAGSISFGKVIYKNNENLSTETKDSYQEVLAGEFLINPLNLNYDLLSLRTALSTINVVVSTGYIVLLCEQRLVKNYVRWLLYQFDVAHMKTLGAGVRQTINFSDIGNSFFLEPSPEEQQKIAQFLDHETAKIDTLIEKQQRLIELLKEKRQAVISHAVTKGLNPNAPMKDSGVEWLGEVPEGWVICRLKHIKSIKSNAFVDGPFGSNLKSEHFIDNGDVYVIESNFATTGKIDVSNLKQISQQHFETIKRSETKDGDIILAKIGARYGSSSILPKLDKQAVVSGNSLKLTVNPSLISNEYANEFLCILKANDAMDEGVNVTAQPALSLGGLNNLPFLRIPLIEQNQIIDYVKRIQTKFDSLIEKSNSAIELMQERRTALISAAVTGKIDVREWGD